MSIRGLDDRTLARLKSRAKQEGSNLNSLVLRLLQGTAVDDRVRDARRARVSAGLCALSGKPIKRGRFGPVDRLP